MIQRFRRQSNGLVPRKGITMLLAFWLNLALLPCAMALESPENKHDCCPPTIELQQSDCCELEAAAIDNRDGKFEQQNDSIAVSIDTAWQSLQTLGSPMRDARPPDPVDHSPALHKLFCVYLD